MPAPSVILSNGFARYNLVAAAVELARKGLLARFITGAYPAGRLWRLICRLGLARGRKLGRLIRRGDAIPDALIEARWGGEAIQALGMALERLPGLTPLGHRLAVAGFRLYGRAAARIIRNDAGGANIYHYRSGFGHTSVGCARARGMIALCEHTIAHPRLVEHLVGNRGRLPAPGVSPRPNRFWRNLLDDLGTADHILVNSDFVRQTFLHQGWPAERVHVIYLGVDDQFLAMLPPRAEKAGDGTLRLLFAGDMEMRKGADTLTEALSDLNDLPWRLEIAGGISPDARRRHRRFFADPRVHPLGLLPRDGIAARMAAADVFVFPSLAEGSARVVFEALAAGCFVVTTPNSGSIVEDRRHGLLVPPGDAPALRDALRQAFLLGEARSAIGAANAALVRERYRQRDYGDALAALYGSLLAGAERAGERAGGRTGGRTGGRE